MIDIVKRFIEKNISLIEKNKWEEIYKKAEDELRLDTGRFTESMLEADIHPENYLNELPDKFLYESDIKEFIIPKNITSIGAWAFDNCKSLTDVVIEGDINSIKRGAFSLCERLANITIPDSVTFFGDLSFHACGDKLVINYKGTKEQWKEVYKINGTESFKRTYFTVNCMDGKIVKKKR